MFCTNCGGRVEKNSKYCGSCGIKLKEKSNLKEPKVEKNHNIEQNNKIKESQTSSIASKSVVNSKNFLILFAILLLSTSTLIIIFSLSGDIGNILRTFNINTGYKNTTTTNSATPKPQKLSSYEEDNVQFALKVIWALENYYMSTVVTSASTENPVLDMMRDSLDRVKYLEKGNNLVDEYTNHNDEIIALTAQGMVLGAETVIKSNNELISKLEEWSNYNASVSDLEYAVAKYLSDSKEGYSYILVSAPQLLSNMWEPAESENPTGPIPYNISESNRKRILNEIDRLFADELLGYSPESTGQYNSVLEAVIYIKNGISPNTYEEAELLE